MAKRAESRIEFEIGVLRWVLIAVVIVAGAFLVYFGWYLRLPLGNPDDWGTFGEYFAGLINPVIGVATVILIIHTIHETRREATRTRREMKQQTDQLRQQFRHDAKQSALADVKKRLDGTLDAWKDAMDTELQKAFRLSKDGQAEISHNLTTFRKYLQNPKMPGEFKALTEGPDRQEVLTRLNREFEWCLHLLDELDLYCRQYDEMSGNRTLTDFYRNRVQLPLRSLHAAGLVEKSLFEGLSVPLRFREFTTV